MSVQVGRSLMKAFGVVQEVMVAQLNGNQGRCICVKVEFDVTKALPRGKRVMSAGWEPFWAPFRYEKLPTLCYYCGIVGHDDKACVLKYKDSKSAVIKDNQYGAWLKASPVKIPARRRMEEGPDFSQSASSAAEMDKERSGNNGSDKVLEGVMQLGLSENLGPIGGKRSILGPDKAQSVEVNDGLPKGMDVDTHTQPDIGINMTQPNSSEFFTNNPHKTLREQKEFEQREKDLAKKEELNEAFLGERGIQPIVQVLETKRANAAAGGKEDGMVDENLASISQGAMEGKGQRKRQTPGRHQRVGNNEANGKASVLPAKRKGEAKSVEMAESNSSIQGLLKKQKVVSGNGVDSIADTVETVDPIGTAGGLVVLWRQDLKVGLVRKSSFFIELLITDEESGREWHLINLVLVSTDWRLNYDRAVVKHLFALGSGHAALLLGTNPPKMQGFRQFRFDSRWCEDPESYEVVKRCWNGAYRGSKMFGVFQKVRNCRKELRNWSKQKGFNARKKITDLQQKLESIGSDQRSGVVGEVRALEKELSTTWDKEEKKWNGEQEILSQATNEFHDFVSAMAKTRGPRQPVGETVSIWSPPTNDVLKINSGGAFDGSGKRGGVGLVAKDHLGHVKWTIAIPISNIQSAEAVEALGFRWAVTLAKDKGGEHFSFEGDAQCIVQMLQGVKAAKSSLAPHRSRDSRDVKEDTTSKLISDSSRHEDAVIK
ncbi:hypothetical protein Vadar_032999 [Vaccinium darrowii]|uniref:Uncharacterized protein n=1 Tax=Vaccinium darrowii TaxID=229202 RepID=A0ACB7XDZ6_9ERIC|nr:hypothetical protein Vadar_032999 [Vaccinium darrowii]